MKEFNQRSQEPKEENQNSRHRKSAAALAALLTIPLTPSAVKTEVTVRSPKLSEFTNFGVTKENPPTLTNESFTIDNIAEKAGKFQPDEEALKNPELALSTETLAAVYEVIKEASGLDVVGDIRITIDGLASDEKGTDGITKPNAENLALAKQRRDYAVAMLKNFFEAPRVKITPGRYQESVLEKNIAEPEDGDRSIQDILSAEKLNLPISLSEKSKLEEFITSRRGQRISISYTRRDKNTESSSFPDLPRYVTTTHEIWDFVPAPKIEGYLPEEFSTEQAPKATDEGLIVDTQNPYHLGRIVVPENYSQSNRKPVGTKSTEMHLRTLSRSSSISPNDILKK